MQAEQDGTDKTYRGRFLFFGTGYYNYDKPYSPEFPGIENFTGEVVHPQYWPESLDYTGKRVVVIGSGATAISMIPSLTEKAAHVTMLQRSPSYMLSMPRIEPMARASKKCCRSKLAHSIVRRRNALFFWFMYLLARKAPKVQQVADPRTAPNRTCPKAIPSTCISSPVYNPWDQRMCMILDNDFYKAIGDGRVDVVTDHIDHIDANGNRTEVRSSPRRRRDRHRNGPADCRRWVASSSASTATRSSPQDRFVYKEHMLEDIPNMAWCVGYINASWTLRADLTARSVAKLLAYMDSHGYTHAYPHLGDKPMPEKPAWNINAGYVQRAAHVLPKSGTHRPWNVRHNYVLDAIDHRFDRIEESMVFGRASAEAAKSA